MLIHKKSRLIAATDKKIFFWEGCSVGHNSAFTELPLAEFLAHEMDGRLLLSHQKNRSKILLIVPDHWFKHEFFLFKSQKDSLIKPFIQRKLKTAYPNLPLARHFFSYSCRQKAVEGAGVRVFHLYEQKAFDLYEALCKTNLTPRWITSPALLWEEHFRLRVPEFSSQAALLVNLHHHKAFLYFFFHGDFLFSREVALPENAERWDALLFEANQSIYLFSQKAKSDLNKIYLIGNETSFHERLSDVLARPVQMVSRTGAANALPLELASLEGLLDPCGLSVPADAYSVTHSRIQQELKWRPVQWIGMLVAVMLLVFFIGEHRWLEGRLLEETNARIRMRQQQPVELANYAAALSELIEDAKRPSAAHAILNLVSALPDDVLIHEVKIDSDALRLEFAAIVYADAIDRFRQLLKGLIENLNRRLNLNPPLAVEDMAFNMEETKNQTGKTHYKIACKINLP